MSTEIKMIQVDKLIPHPRNNDFFDDISGEAWEKLCKSIRENGIYESLIVSPNMIVVSGTQRLRAAKAVGLAEVPCVIKTFENESKLIQALIEINLLQRGVVQHSTKQMANIIKALEEANEVHRGGNGNNQYTTRNQIATGIASQKSTNMSDIKVADGEKSVKSGNMNNVHFSTENESSANEIKHLSTAQIAEQLGINLRTYGYYKRLATLIPELQDETFEENGKISMSVASRILAQLSEEEQLQVANQLHSVEKLTEAKAKKMVEEIRKSKDSSDNTVEAAKEEARKQRDLAESVKSALQKEKEDSKKAKEELERIKSQLKISSAESNELKKRISELEEYIDADARIEEESGDPLFGKYNVLKFGELMDNIGVALNPFMAQPEVFNYATLDEVKFAHEKVSTLLSYIGEIEEQLAQREEVLRKRKR